MKKIIQIFLVLIILVSLLACKSSKENNRNLQNLPSEGEKDPNLQKQSNEDENVVTVHINGKVSEYKVNDTFSIDMIDKDSEYNYLGLYLDEEYTITFSGEVKNNIELYVKTEEVKRNKHISYFVDGELYRELDLDSKDAIPDISGMFNPRYEVSIYSDENMTIVDDNIFDSDKDTSIYYQLNEKEEYKNIVIVRVYADSTVARIELEKGEYLDAYLIYASLGFTKNYNLFYDEECTISYDFMPVEEDLILYNNSGKDFNVTEDDFAIPPLDEMVKVSYVYLLSNGEEVSKSIFYDKGTEITASDFRLFRDEYVSGIYLDKDCTIPFESEVLSTEITLYGKVEEPDENAHKVTIYYGYCINQDRVDGKEYNDLYREFYIRDGASITDFRRNMEELVMHWLVDEDGNLYNGEEIKSDVTFYALNSGLPYSNKYIDVKRNMYIYHYNDSSKALFVIGDKTNLTGYDFRLYDASIYLDSEYNVEYTSGYTFEELWLK